MFNTFGKKLFNPQNFKIIFLFHYKNGKNEEIATAFFLNRKLFYAKTYSGLEKNLFSE